MGTQPSINAQELLQHSDWMRRLARQLVQDPAQAEDLTQEAYLAALRTRPETGRSLRAWLATVMRNVVRQNSRGLNRREHREELSARGERVDSTYDLVARLSSHRSVVDALMGLEEPYRGTLIMRFFEGLTPSAIARREGIPLSTVKTRLSRGLARLRRRLDTDFASDGRSWVLALMPLTQDSGGRLAAILGTLLLSTPLKLVLVAGALALGVFYVWPAALADGDSAGQQQIASALDSEDASPAGIPHATGAGSGARRALGQQPAEAQPDGSETREHNAAEELSPALLRVRALHSDGRIAAGVRLSVELQSKARSAQEYGGGTLFRLDPQSPAQSDSAEPGEDQALQVLTDGEGRSSTPFAAKGYRIRSATPGQVALLEGWIGRSDAHRGEAVVILAPHQPLAGRVVDESGKAIKDALVEINLPGAFRSGFDVSFTHSREPMLRATSDASGAFSLLQAGYVAEAMMSVVKEGYRPWKMALPESSDQAMLITLERPQRMEGSLSGRVVNPDGHVVQDARVSFGLEVTRTDEYGVFHFELGHAGGTNERMLKNIGLQPRTLAAMVAGYQPARFEVPMLADGSGLDIAEDIVLELGPTPLILEGRIVNQKGAALEGIQVWVRDATVFGLNEDGVQMLESFMAGQPADFWYSEVSDERGLFELRGMSDQDYVLALMDPATLAQNTSAPLRPGTGRHEVVFVRGKSWSRLRGRVVDGAGNPVDGVTVIPMCDAYQVRHGGRTLGTQHSTLEAVRTDEEGRFLFEDIPQDLVYLRLDGKSMVPLEYGRHAEDGLYGIIGSYSDEFEIVVALRRRARIELQDPTSADAACILNAEGEPIEISIFLVSGRRETRRLRLEDGRTEVFSVGSNARYISLFKGTEEVQRIALTLIPGEVNVIRP